jgi:hypothetical protein
MPDPDVGLAGLALPELQAECSGWRCWRGLLSGTYYAIRADQYVRGGYQLHADTPAGLYEQIRRADAQNEDVPVELFGRITAEPPGASGGSGTSGA